MKEIKKEERNELDDQGNPYPVLYMRLKKIILENGLV